MIYLNLGKNDIILKIISADNVYISIQVKMI